MKQMLVTDISLTNTSLLDITQGVKRRLRAWRFLAFVGMTYMDLCGCCWREAGTGSPPSSDVWKCLYFTKL